MKLNFGLVSNLAGTLAGKVHRHDLDFWIHPDDRIEAITPDFIEIGDEVFNLNTS